VSNPSCGWCAATRSCVNGTMTGPNDPDRCFISWTFGDPNRCPNCAAKTGSCIACQSTPDCIACAGDNQKCIDRGTFDQNCVFKLPGVCLCGMHENCRDCQTDTSNSCYWCEEKGVCLAHGASAPPTCIKLDVQPPTPCPACDSINSCQTCSQTSGCGWCNAQCQPVTTCNALKAEILENCDADCKTMLGCEPCLLRTGCSWCSNRNTCEGKDIVHLGPSCTEATDCPRPSSFDGPSFIGGMFLVIGLVLLVGGSVLLYRFYRRRVTYTAV